MNVWTCLFLLLSSLFVAALPASAQDYLYATGSPVYATRLPIDHGFVNLNNGEVHIEIPITTKQQRGDLSLNYRLVYDSRIWKITPTSSTLSWTPTNGGWLVLAGDASNGLLTSVTTEGTNPNVGSCQGSSNSNKGFYYNFSNWTWQDPFGTVHSFPSVSTVEYAYCPGAAASVPTSSGYASDGSGYFLSVTNGTTAVVTDVYGRTYTPYTQNNVVHDSNGNYLSVDANSNVIDTSGQTPVLSTIGHANDGGNIFYYDVLVKGGSRVRYTVTMTLVAYATAFHQSSVGESSGYFWAVKSIALPDGSSYTFNYDSGTSGNYGELTTMTLPTGGVISFEYSTFFDSYQNMNRWVTGVVKDGGTTTISPAVVSNCTSSSGCQETQTVHTPDGNETVYAFSLDKTAIVAGESWVSGITAYQGTAATGIPIRKTSTSYTYGTYPLQTLSNGSYVSSGSYQVPTSVTNTVTLSEVDLSSQTTTTFYPFLPLASDVKTWDFGVSPSGAPTTDTAYGLYYCGTPSSVTVKDGSGNQISSIINSFDQTTPVATSNIPSHTTGVNSCNRTSERDWVNTAGTTLNTTMIYNDTGALLTSTSPNGTTTYGYDPTDTFVTSVTDPPVPSGVTLETQTAYDASTGAVTSTTDPNNQVTSYSSFDMFNRPTLISYPDGGTTTIIYRNPNQVGVFRAQSSNQTMETETLYDGYGRVSRVAVAKDAATSDWYQTDTCYDTDGRASFASYAYEGTGWGTAKVCSGAGDTTSYDALSRPLSILHGGDGTRIGYQYKGRATEVTDENGVARITQADAFGRPTSVCEISSNTLEGDAPTACGTDIAGTGFVTSYAYNLASHLTTVTQGVQTRMFQTDSLGRTIATSEPERGSTTYTYTYNSTGLLMARIRPRPNQNSASVTTGIATQYDALGRVSSISYSDGTPTKNFLYDVSAGWGETQSNLKGRLSKALVAALGNYEGDIFSYDQMGRILFTGQCFAYGCGNGADDKYINDVYDWVGNLTSQYDPTAGVIDYTYNPANQLLSATNQTYTDSTNPPDLISNVQNGPNGPISYQQGNGLGDYRTYDGLGRLYGKWVCQGTSPSFQCETGSEPQIYGTELSWSGNEVTANCDTVIGTCRNFGYDEFGRLKSQSVNSQTQYSYVYDRYGNRWQQNAAQGGPSPSVAFTKSTNQIIGDSYDAAGNMTSDGIHTYTYDPEGNVTAVDGGNTASYTYDALNRRVRVANASGTDDYTFDAMGRRVTEWQESTNFGIEASEYWGTSSERIAYRNGPTVFEQQDWLGTERVRTTASGAVQNDYASLPFGDGFSGTGSDPDPAHFAELDHDAESATDHAQFRQYSEAMGRWMSPDPYDGSYDWSDPQSYNRYSYVENNPLGLVDPSGLDWTYNSEDGCLDYWDESSTTLYGYGCGSGSYAGSLNGGGGYGLGGYGGYGGAAISLAALPTPITRSEAPNSRTPNTITCGTVLPNGRTVGSYVNQLSNSINGSAGSPTSTPYGPGPNPSTPGPFSVASQVYSGTNFKIMFRGQGSAAFLGDAGNFAYAAVSGNIGVPLWATEAVAGGYALWAGHQDANGPWRMDASATAQVPAGYSAGCQGY